MSLFRRKPATTSQKGVVGSVAERPEVALTAERNDHGFVGNNNATINFEGYDLLGANGVMHDVHHGFGAAEVVPGVWVSRIAGLSHHPGAMRSPRLKPLEEVLLKHEPDNPRDPNATQIWLADHELAGYVPADVASQLRALLLPGGWAAARILGVYSLPHRGPIGMRLMIPFGADVNLTVHDPD